MRSLICLILAMGPLVTPGLTEAAAPIGLTIDEFKMYRQYKNALEDPRVQKLEPKARLPAIAKDAGFKVADLKRSVEKGDAEPDVAAACEQAYRAALSATTLAKSVQRVLIDADEPHAVAYVEWANDDLAFVEEEAALAASAARACPILSSIQVWAVARPKPSVRVFQGLISSSAAARIKPDQIKDFADTRYIRLFEKVKNAANGDDLTPSDAGVP